MGLGRTTRFAPLPPGARRVNVMRAGKAGVKELAPPPDLFDDFNREKKAVLAEGWKADHAHYTAFRRTRYRDRFAEHVRASPESLATLRALIEESRRGDVYVMCMCPYQAAGDSCHTYVLLELARELDPTVALLDEPRPKR